MESSGGPGGATRRETQRADRVTVPTELLALIRRAYLGRRTRARLIVEHCLKRLPHYRRLPRIRLAEVRESVLHHVTLFYRVTLQAGRALTSEDLVHSRQMARQRAVQGTPLGEYLTFFQAGLTLLWEHLMELIGEDPVLRAQLLERVDLILSNQTRLMSALTESYVEERERLSRFREQDIDEFFQLLLSEDTADSLLEARARGLGVPLDEPHAVAIFGPATSTATEGAAVAPDDVRRLLASRMPEAATWVGHSREGFVALLPGEPDASYLEAVAEELRGGDRRVGLGGAARYLAGARRSAREALRALRIGTILRHKQRVHRYADLAVLDLVGIGSPEADAFVQRVLDPLMPSGQRAYLETLRHLSRSGYRVKVAAAALSVHPHTLTYRLKQLRSRFGFDLADPETRLRVDLALLILDAQGRTSGERARRPPGSTILPS
jgi:DNA-binding PucR family transcriptional regulator